MSRRNWKTYQPTSLRDALQACKDYALQRHNLSVELIAQRMGQEDHWSLYKWLASGRMPLVLVHAYEHACGCCFVTRWMAAASGKLLVDMPRGKAPKPGDVVAINSGCARALQLLTDFYASNGQADPAATLEALRTHLEEVAYHHKNVATFVTPELEF
ncbi:hypothetical protein G8A07_15680 [Roseateles sp. DAIF2]|uniref:hypothetical protein n=1 Tax=Roseateles sp. DAIF2 TaxID=2714952 RepID=UPI0018A268FE|nr:hypothetical protein [Roseateles sp. DAIF2]QPF74215.1 hypothetical protein G8A07_15680 [Roseateles sp. DAIF2]